MNIKTECCECGRIGEGLRQILKFEPGDGWYIVRTISGDMVETMKERWEGHYICPECYEFEVHVMHSRITFSQEQTEAIGSLVDV